jgi:hypothetical protein
MRRKAFTITSNQNNYPTKGQLSEQLTMKHVALFYVVDPIVALGGTGAALMKTGFYDYIGQTAPTAPAEWFTNVGATGLLGFVLWFLMTRMQSSIDKNTAAVENLPRAIADAISDAKQ